MDIITLGLAKKYADKKIKEAVLDGAKVELDDTLTKAGSAAEARAVGNKIKEIETKIPNFDKAGVGQSFVVKAVDENGKPTEWEAVDKPVHIAKVGHSEDGFILADDEHESLLKAYNNGVTVYLNFDDVLFYLVKVDENNNLHFAQIPYSITDIKNNIIPSGCMMVAPDNSITLALCEFATMGFVNQTIAKSMPKKLSEMENDLFSDKEVFSVELTADDMNNGEPFPSYIVENVSVKQNYKLSGMLHLEGVDYIIDPAETMLAANEYGHRLEQRITTSYGPVIPVVENINNNTDDGPVVAGKVRICLIGLLPTGGMSFKLNLKMIARTVVPETAIPDTIARKTDILTEEQVLQLIEENYPAAEEVAF